MTSDEHMRALRTELPEAVDQFDLHYADGGFSSSMQGTYLENCRLTLGRFSGPSPGPSSRHGGTR